MSIFHTRAHHHKTQRSKTILSSFGQFIYDIDLFILFYKITCILCMLWLDKPHFLSEYRDTAGVIFILYWSTKMWMTSWKLGDLGYFIKQIKITFVSLYYDRNIHHPISNGKIPENTQLCLVFLLGIFLVEMTCFYHGTQTLEEFSIS